MFPPEMHANAKGKAAGMEYQLHPSAELQNILASKRLPHQGQDLEKASVLFVGQDANYSPQISDDPVFFRRILEYHEDGVAFWRRHGVHHPFLLPGYPLPRNTGGVPYHRKLASIELAPESAAKRVRSSSMVVESKVDFEGIQLNVDWQPDRGISVDELPAVQGIYAEIHWPKMGVRVGETGRSIRTKIRHDIRWFNSMWEGSAPPAQLRRTIPIAGTAKEFGATAFEFYVVSIDPRLSDKALRQECERYMFRWLEQHTQFVSWNYQRSWR